MAPVIFTTPDGTEYIVQPDGLVEIEGPSGRQQLFKEAGQDAALSFLKSLTETASMPVKEDLCAAPAGEDSEEYRNRLTKDDLARWDTVRQEVLEASKSSKGSKGVSSPVVSWHPPSRRAKARYDRCERCGSTRIVRSLMIRCSVCGKMVCRACQQKHFRCSDCATLSGSEALLSGWLKELSAENG